eukprot:Rhum_TRINITY_DN3997_c0_g1::Rhum_TRINITY_DN3997_c0_g1_i1::g.12643::m.12643
MASFPLSAGPFDPAGTTWRLKAHLQREAADSLARETRQGDARARAVPAYPSRLGDFDCGAVPPAFAAGTPATHPAPASSPPRARLGSADADIGAAAAAARGSSSGYLAALREQGPPSPAVSATRVAADAASSASAAAVPPSNGAGGGGSSNAVAADAFLLSIQQLHSRARMGVVAQALHDLQPVPYEVPRFPPHEPAAAPAPLAAAAATHQQPAAVPSSGRLRTPLSHALQPQPHAYTQGSERPLQPPADALLALSPSLSTDVRRFGSDSPSLLPLHQSPSSSPPRQQRQQSQQPQPHPTSDLATLVSECLGAESEEDELLLFRAVFGSTARERRRRADGRAARRPARARAREAAFASPPDVVKAAVRMGLRREPENVAPMVEVLSAVDVGGGAADVAAAAAAAEGSSSSSGDSGGGGGGAAAASG